MREISVAATQMACTWDIEANVQRAESLVDQAAAQGAQLVLLQELFEAPYFCKDQKAEYFSLAKPAANHPLIQRFAKLAKKLQVVLPLSFFERDEQAYFNSLAMIDADGEVLGIYRKSHIPDGPGYQEKFFFSPGDTGFKVWQTRYGKMGVGICWDQWFPEAARCMALMGAEVLFYPTAIGSEPEDDIDSAAPWQRVMCGHAVANHMPVIASNRIGHEAGEACHLDFYGSSFIADEFGAKVQEANREDESVLVHRFDLDAIQNSRANWGFFRDRRPELYASMKRLGG
ncbi:MAG: N-carbamoylputrescine amidase [Xanthomonadales bacterium]|nr:N-carbamoylputrescine amidase [Xanthomonadales bacterium]